MTPAWCGGRPPILQLPLTGVGCGYLSRAGVACYSRTSHSCTGRSGIDESGQHVRHPAWLMPHSVACVHVLLHQAVCVLLHQAVYVLLHQAAYLFFILIFFQQASLCVWEMWWWWWWWWWWTLCWWHVAVTPPSRLERGVSSVRPDCDRPYVWLSTTLYLFFYLCK